MFDRVIEKPRVRRWTTAVIVASAIAHGAAGAALAVSAMWKIERLPVSVTTQIEIGPRLPTGESAPKAGARLEVQKVAEVVKPKLRSVTEPVQPTRNVTDAVPQLTGTGSEPGTGGGGGDGTDPEGTGTCAVEPCSGGATEEPEEVVETCTTRACRCEQDPALSECKPVVVAPGVAKGLRISGNEKIYPPEGVKVAMLHQGKDTIQGTFQICVSERGQIDRVRTLRSTGFADYDRELTSAMHAWRYRPYLVAGVPSPMCTVEVVIFRMRK